MNNLVQERLFERLDFGTKSSKDTNKETDCTKVEEKRNSVVLTSTAAATFREAREAFKRTTLGERMMLVENKTFIEGTFLTSRRDIEEKFRFHFC